MKLDFLKPKTPPFYLKSGRFSKHYRINNLNRGAIAVGGAGSGKTYSYINPLLSYCVKHKGCITFDPKGELTPLINGIAKQNEKPIINFSLDNNFNTINVLSLCEDKSDIIEFSSYFLSGIVGIPKNDAAKYFFNSAKSILTGTILFLRKKHPKFCSIPHIIALFLTANPEQIIKLIFSDEEAKRSAQVLSSVSGDKKLLGSMMSTFTAFFASLDVPRIFRNLLSDTDLPLPNDPNNPSIINLIFNLQKRDIYSPIYSSIIGLILKKMNIPDQHESAVIIDEFTVLSIPNFSNIPETARSNKIATCIAIQDFSQLVLKYGKEEASSIIANMGSQFLFRTTSPETLDHFQKTLGKREVEKTSISEKQGGLSLDGPTHSYSSIERDILRREKVINYKAGMCTAIIAEGNERLIEGKRLNGNHYLKKIKPIPIQPQKNIDEQRAYEKVYSDINFLLKKSTTTPTLTKKFNL
ncbi:type IV secretory system conjugative DNA transfer family protein [Aquimarina agarilytica]|uniref:type IV secretory system conjugative DNA transfer family protein n=1 Tax=Aquimarina agarilytica TaxID=1087449 RepID=UPI0002897DAC|nr:type IV secretory system conjugative DNA transfer family protein [Aquimarina agarilytica]